MRRKFDILASQADHESFLRSISCYLISISHVFTFSHFTLSNKVHHYNAAETLFGNIFTVAALLVDG